jgi:hypothetical protein
MSDYNTHAKKESLFRAMREGKIRVLIGSPKNMGTGRQRAEAAPRCTTWRRRGIRPTWSSRTAASCARATRTPNLPQLVRHPGHLRLDAVADDRAQGRASSSRR